MSEPLLEVRGLRKFFSIAKGFLQRVAGHVRAVDGVDFTLQEGETLGLVGESSCGKTTASRCILRAIDPTGGEILYRTRAGSVVDLATLTPTALKPLRTEIQMIFQDPFGSLNPRMTLHDNVGEPLLVNGMGNRRERTDRVADLLKLVGLRPEFMHRFPHAFSGGQRQRIGIVRALATNPRLRVADEPVSALDVAVQAQVLNLLLELQSRLKLTFLLVAHDLSVFRHISDRIAVMYVGQIVELAPADELFRRPRHPRHGRLDACGPGSRPAHPDNGRHSDRRGPQPRRTAIRLLFPPKMPPRKGSVPQRSTAPAGDRPRPLLPLPLRGESALIPLSCIG